MRKRPEDNKTNLGIKVDIDLWNEFRKRAIDEGEKTGTILVRLIRDYLNMPEKKEPDPDPEKNETSGKGPGVGGKRPTRGNYPEPD